MNFLEKSSNVLKNGVISVYDLFPKTLTFWSVLFYFFFFYFVVYIFFLIYIYVNGLEYEIDCTNKDKCVTIKKKDDKPEKPDNKSVITL